MHIYFETLILVGRECLVLGEAGLSRKLQICKLGTLPRSSKGAFIVARTHSPFPVNTERLSFMNTPNVVRHIDINNLIEYVAEFVYIHIHIPWGNMN